MLSLHFSIKQRPFCQNVVVFLTRDPLERRVASFFFEEKHKMYPKGKTDYEECIQSLTSEWSLSRYLEEEVFFVSSFETSKRKHTLYYVCLRADSMKRFSWAALLLVFQYNTHHSLRQCRQHWSSSSYSCLKTQSLLSSPSFDPLICKKKKEKSSWWRWWWSSRWWKEWHCLLEEIGKNWRSDWRDAWSQESTETTQQSRRRKFVIQLSSMRKKQYSKNGRQLIAPSFEQIEILSTSKQ